MSHSLPGTQLGPMGPFPPSGKRMSLDGGSRRRSGRGCYTAAMAVTGEMITAEKLAELSLGKRVELVRGEIIEMTPPGGDHGSIVIALGGLLRSHVRTRKLGFVSAEWGVVLSRKPDTVRGPDIAFVSAERLKGKSTKGFFEGAPDLAVEVISPNDRASEVQQKIKEYLQAGTRLVWVIDPETRTLTAYHPSGEARIYSADDEVPGEDVVPGFSFRPADLFEE